MRLCSLLLGGGVQAGTNMFGFLRCCVHIMLTLADPAIIDYFCMNSTAASTHPIPSHPIPGLPDLNSVTLSAKLIYHRTLSS